MVLNSLFQFLINYIESFEEILARSKGFPERISFIYSVQAKAKSPEIFAWCQKESDKILSAYNATTTKDIPTILSIINQAGLEDFIRWQATSRLTIGLVY